MVSSVSSEKKKREEQRIVAESQPGHSVEVVHPAEADQSKRPQYECFSYGKQGHMARTCHVRKRSCSSSDKLRNENLGGRLTRACAAQLPDILMRGQVLSIESNESSADRMKGQ